MPPTTGPSWAASFYLLSGGSMALIEITCRFSGKVLFSHDAENNSVRLALEVAIKAGANLAGANLAGANLAGANLAGADLSSAYLARANLAGANLYSANLYGANLAGANLYSADLAGKEKLIGQRPIFQIGPVGSRGAYLLAFITDSGLRIRAGCFYGTKEQFIEKVKSDHGDTNHAKEYMAVVALIEKHAEISTPAVLQETAQAD